MEPLLSGLAIRYFLCYDEPEDKIGIQSGFEYYQGGTIMERICLLPCESRGTIAPEIYGHFSEHIGGVFRDGLWVGEDSAVSNTHGFRQFVIDRFRELAPPVLRWPGGCFAETYKWRDGIGAREKRPKTMGWWYRNDGRLETNEVGIHEFADFCRLTGAKPYVAANITGMTPMDMRDFMEYCGDPAHSTTLSEERAQNGDEQPFNIPYWGIGNENWGGGGNMTPEQYAREFIRYSTLCQTVNLNDARYIACGANASDYLWTDGFMKEWGGRVPLYALAFHYYCGGAGDPVAFSKEEWETLVTRAGRIGELIERHGAAMDLYDPERKVKIICDEWGCWHPAGSGPSKGYNLFEQQSTMRDGVITALSLNSFNNHCDRVAMANAAQLCNNLHCLFLTGGENAIVTPTYWVYWLYRGHQNAEHIRTAVEGENLSVSASRKDGETLITVANLSFDAEKEVELSAFGAESLPENGTLTVLGGNPHAHNTFDAPEAVKPQETMKFQAKNGKAVATLPPASVAKICLR